MLYFAYSMPADLLDHSFWGQHINLDGPQQKFGYTEGPCSKLRIYRQHNLSAIPLLVGFLPSQGLIRRVTLDPMATSGIWVVTSARQNITSMVANLSSRLIFLVAKVTFLDGLKTQIHIMSNI